MKPINTVEVEPVGTTTSPTGMGIPIYPPSSRGGLLAILRTNTVRYFLLPEAAKACGIEQAVFSDIESGRRTCATEEDWQELFARLRAFVDGRRA